MKKYSILFVFLSLQACDYKQFIYKNVSQTKYVWELNRLYFGRSMLDAREVSEHEWKQLLAEYVTPAFPEGLTVWHAEEQWQNDSSRMVQERTFVMEIAYLPDTLKNRKIQVIIDKYRSCFRQQSVMRVIEQVKVAF